MSEKEDLMALAFMVGGEINNIKQTANDRSRFVSESLPNPRDFVMNVAKQDITQAVQNSKKQTVAIQNQLAKQNNSNNQQPVVNNTVSGNTDNLLQQVVEQLKTTNGLLTKFAARAGLL